MGTLYQSNWRHSSRDLIHAQHQYHVHQQNVNRSGSNMQSSQTLCITSPVLLSISRCSQTPLELSGVLSDCARALSSASENTCSYGGAFRMLRDLIYRTVKVWSFSDLCTDVREISGAALRELSRAAASTAQHCRRLGAIFSQPWFLYNHRAFHLIIFVFVPVARFATS